MLAYYGTNNPHISQGLLLVINSGARRCIEIRFSWHINMFCFPYLFCFLVFCFPIPKLAYSKLRYSQNGLKLSLINPLSLRLYFHTIERNSWYCTKFCNALFSKVYASSAIYFNIHISLSKGIETNYVLSQLPRYHWYHMNSYIIQKADFFSYYYDS